MKQLADQYGADALVVVFGLNELANLRIMATTFRSGDPSYAGALGGVALGLASYHILELRDEIPPEVWREEMAMKELEIGEPREAEIHAALAAIRGEAAAASGG